MKQATLDEDFWNTPEVKSVMQEITISYLIIKSQLPKFGFSFIENYVKSPLFGSIFAAILVIIMMFAAPHLSYFFTIILFYFAMFIFVNILEKRERFCIILLVISTIATILLFAFLYQYVNKPYGLLLLNIYPLFLIIIGLVDCRSINKDDVIK